MVIITTSEKCPLSDEHLLEEAIPDPKQKCLQPFSSLCPLRNSCYWLAVSVPFRLLPHGENNMPCPEMKIQLDRMKKSLPLEKNRPDSAISSKMFLTIHRLTLQVRARVLWRKGPTWKSHPFFLEAGRIGFLFCPVILAPTPQELGLCVGEGQCEGRVWAERWLRFSCALLPRLSLPAQCCKLCLPSVLAD